MSENTNLQPIPANKRIMDLLSYLFLWLGGCVSIGTFALGSGQLEKG
ncbi:TPA: transporter, partial [Mannheimia haemolytica]|nr:transporter [Mannheimia haemolytica]